ncbi:hypothetical protein BCR33DRAFT_711389 [Rhizoclosmatium globosum]|uniref:Uncharacterized protein n=1 Tax=Rhizoclosmatium globosum TaxID=329046 RepID=A0A1Y2D154_9FUNG|nr:hypothetical protein HDU79_002514 [Rhizoclosmatium sp. JEL0117]ORY52992.1 hypothetical protein BCR33DRAFT_711389 [Rhizoclosmatium globosum]|eukprot:ORY52992.1 hypothetical protein BCR33DRAFT_711389 [Rhizoclosmatium globosum]
MSALSAPSKTVATPVAVQAAATAPTAVPATGSPINAFGSLPVNWQTAEGLPQEPTMNPFHNKTQTNTLRGAITVYLIAISIWILIELVISFFGAAFVGSWIGVILYIISLVINALMFYAIQPERLIPIWMTVFAFFYIARAIIDVALAIYILVVTPSFFLGAVLFEACITALEVTVFYFMVKRSLTYRAYALEVRQKLSSQGPTNVIATETAIAASV